MSRRSRLNNFLVGSARIESRIEYKQAVLRGQLSLLLGSVSLFYMIVDPINGIYLYLPLYLGALLFSALVIYLNNIRKPIAASIVLLTVTNILVFLIADASMPDSGVFFFFPSIALVSLVLFYHSNLKLGTIFMTLPTFLGIVAYYNQNALLGSTILTGVNKDMNFTINLMLGIFTSVIILLYVIKRNNESEASLVANKGKLEKLAAELQGKNNELQKANDELDRFVYSASHDLRAPLSTLLGLIEVAKTTKDEKEYPQFFDLMISRINDMEGFISDVTDYSRNARLEMNYTKINLQQILVSLKDSFDFLARKSKVKINLELEDCSEITTDATRLKVVLNNLLANAIKYHDPRKDNRHVNISAVSNKETCSIIVEDNGLGILEKYQDKIFDMFYRASENSTGSGLGLYIVKETLDRLNGTINFESKPMIGSKFIVKIPINNT